MQSHRYLPLAGMLLVSVLLTATLFLTVQSSGGGLQNRAQASAAHGPEAPAAADGLLFSLDGIEMLAPTLGFLLEDTGLVFRYNGASWSLDDEIADVEEMGTLHMVSPSEGWASGTLEVGQSTNASFWRYDGSTWTPVATPFDELGDEASAIDFVEPGGQGWATGDRGILRWDGVNWTISLEDEEFEGEDISAVAENDVWAIGDGVIYHHTQTDIWTAQPISGFLRSIEMIETGDVLTGWAVGRDGLIAHYDVTSATWISIASPVTGTLGSVDLLPDGSAGWAVGGRNVDCPAPPDSCVREGWTAFYDGATWQEVDFPFNDFLEDVSIVSATEAWGMSSNLAVRGDTNLYHYINGAWQLATPVLLNDSPVPGAPGSFFVFRGSGFDPDITVDVCVNRQKVGEATTDSAGEFDIAIQTSAGTAPGVYYFVANTPSSCPNVASAEAVTVDGGVEQSFHVDSQAPVVPLPAGFDGDVLELPETAEPAQPALTVTKTAGLDSAAAGSAVTFTVQVDNAGDGLLNLDSMTDDIYGDVADSTNPALVSTTCVLPRGLPQGQSYACAFAGAVEGAAGTIHTNTVSVLATTVLTTQIEETASAAVLIEDSTAATLTITKTVSGPAPADDWSFAGPSGAFTLPASGGSQSFIDLPTGTYTLSETVHISYTAAVSCTNGVTGTNSVAVSLNDGDAVGCIFTNTYVDEFTEKIYLPAVE